MNNVCGQCVNYIGGGDWNLCCSKQEQWLCYEDTDAIECKSFEQTNICKNITSYVGMFRCSICGYFAKEIFVEDNCPNCKSEITGALWEGQKHYK